MFWEYLQTFSGWQVFGLVFVILVAFASVSAVFEEIVRLVKNPNEPRESRGLKGFYDDVSIGVVVLLALSIYLFFIPSYSDFKETRLKKLELDKIKIELISEVKFVDGIYCKISKISYNAKNKEAIVPKPSVKVENCTDASGKQVSIDN